MQKIIPIIYILLLCLGVGTSRGAQKTIQARKTDIPPQIDGYVEDIWTTTDSTTDFVQRSPNRGAPPTEKTVAYLLYDDRNIYVAFTCYDSHPDRIDTRPGQRDNTEGDEVSVILDTFNDDLRGYSFSVNVANVQQDSYFSEDGSSAGGGWNGVWFSAVQRTSVGYTVEMKIPFKTLGYGEGLTEWGIDFQRFISHTGEDDSWSVYPQGGFRISQMGRLTGIRPPEEGFSLRGFPIEPYPVGLVRLEEGSTSSELGLDLSWKPSSVSQLLLTFNPDFAQVEADPYQVNLGRYPLYYHDHRPFFVEGSEVFSTPLKLFYSRTIGKGLPDGARVPIHAGVKCTAKPERWTLGALGTWTGEKAYSGGTEPESGYYVFRAKRAFWKNSELGGLFAGKRWEGGFNEVVGVDGALKKGLSQGWMGLNYQLARAASKGIRADYAGRMDGSYRARAFSLYGSYRKQGVHFDIGQIGFEPRKGTEQGSISFGYSSPKSRGPFKWFSVSWGTSAYRESIRPYVKKIYSGPAFNATFHNNWKVSTQISFQRRYEMGEWYTNWFIESHFNTDASKPLYIGDVGFWIHRKRYNWRRGYMARQMAFWGGMSYRPEPALKFSFGGVTTVEWKPDDSLEHVSWVWNPTVDWGVTKDVTLRWWNEVNTDLDLHRLNLLISWNFLPKSWMYLAFNQSLDTSGDDVEFKDRIFVTKVRWLFSI